MDYVDACQVLFSLPRFDLQGGKAIKPGLGNIRALLNDLGNPHECYPTVHVAGTNGKGSVSSMLAAILTAAGRSTGLHTSPHLFSLTERIRVDGREAEENWVAKAVSRMTVSIDRIKPSFFEASTALAFLYFAEREVDIAVIEVGMGGRLDATNVIIPELSVITSIGRDHMQQLGGTLPLIAREKAGIIKPGVPVVIGACQPEVVAVVQGVARELASPMLRVCRPEWDVDGDGREVHFTTPKGSLPLLSLDLSGKHQWRNGLVAAAAATVLLPHDILESSLYRGLSQVCQLSGLRARCEVVSRNPVIMIDVSHNEDGIRVAMDCLDHEAPGNSAPHVMIGLARDKDVPSILRVLAERACTVMPVAIPGDRGLRPLELARMAAGVGLRIVEIESAEDGWRQFMELAGPGNRLLITGSHYLVGSLPEELFPRHSVSIG